MSRSDVFFIALLLVGSGWSANAEILSDGGSSEISEGPTVGDLVWSGDLCKRVTDSGPFEVVSLSEAKANGGCSRRLDYSKSERAYAALDARKILPPNIVQDKAQVMADKATVKADKQKLKEDKKLFGKHSQQAENDKARLKADKRQKRVDKRKLKHDKNQWKKSQ